VQHPERLGRREYAFQRMAQQTERHSLIL
jgi:hypothetical protein